MTGRIGRILLIVMLGAGPGIMGYTADTDPRIQSAKAAFQSGMRKNLPAERVAAVTALEATPHPELVELLLRKGCVDPDPTVRFAARKSLTKLAETTELRQVLFQEWQQGSKKGSSRWADQLSALVPTADPSQQPGLIVTLNVVLANPKGDRHSIFAVIDDYADQGDEQAFTALKVLAQVEAFETSFAYRRAILQAAARIRSKGAVGLLVASMENSSGLIMVDTIVALTRITGKNFREDIEAWSKWWQENEPTFEYPEMIGAAINLNTPNTSTFYGLPITAQRIVLVLDTSGSMRGLPIETAKKALAATIESLPERINFNVIAFDLNVARWQQRLVPASPDNKAAAIASVMQRQLARGTRSYAALQAAFDQNPEAIYFLSDGEPTDGLPQQIIESLTLANRVRRISIFTVGVVTERGGGVGLTRFMSPLSQFNWGEFRLVE